jgi:hypothetical protein
MRIYENKQEKEKKIHLCECIIVPAADWYSKDKPHPHLVNKYSEDAARIALHIHSKHIKYIQVHIYVGQVQT